MQQETVYYPWFKKYQTAQLLVDGQVLGVAGKVDPLFFGDIVDGDAFIFELNGDMLLDYKVSGGRYKKTAKYPSVWLDISVFVPLAVMVDDVQKLIFGADDRVKKVELKDFFEKKEWKNQKSLMFRFVIQDENKTLQKKEIDEVSNKVIEAVKTIGAEIR